MSSMTYQGARARPAQNQAKRYFSVSRVRVDAAGWATHVQWSEVDAKSNAHVGLAAVVPVADVVDAMQDGAVVCITFLPPHAHLPDQRLEVVARPQGGQSIALAKRSGGAAPATQLHLHGVAALDAGSVRARVWSGFSPRRRSHKVYAVSKVCVDADGRITHVRWGRVDTFNNTWSGPEEVVGVADAVAALLAGCQVVALFASANGHTPERQFVVADYGDARQTIVLHGPWVAGREIRDMDRMAQPLNR